MTNSVPLHYTLKPLPIEPIIAAAGFGASPQQPANLQQALTLATEYQTSGRLPEAQQLLQKILQQHPAQAHALHLMAVVKHQSGDSAAALSSIAKAIQQAPDNALFLANAAEMHRLQGDLENAVNRAEQAIERDPNLAIAHSNLGIAYYDLEDFERAESCQLRALELQPGFLAAINNLGSIYREYKNKSAAIDTFRRVLSIQANHLEALNNLGAVLTEDEQYDEALQHLAKALQINPNYADAHCNIGQAFIGQEEYAKAELAYNNALLLRPDYPEAKLGIARVLQEKNLIPQAIAIINTVITKHPDKAPAFSLLGVLHTESGNYQQAENAFLKALSIDPKILSAMIGHANLLMELGKTEASEECCQQALSVDEDCLAAWTHLAQLKKTKVGDEHFLALQTSAADLDSMSSQRVMGLQFSLGKCHDDIEEYDKAFSYFLNANQLKRQKVHYDPVQTEVDVEQIVDTFTSSMINDFSKLGTNNPLPIFILGMPRSGTTLTEQIIASHPSVHGAGELPDWLDHCHQFRGTDGPGGFPGNFTTARKKDFFNLGQNYCAGLHRRAPQARRITDKMPANFFALGLIHLCMPQAKIIHVQRNPIDTCLSGFTKLFNRGQYHSYDLEELGLYYRCYHQLMTHWRSVLPAGSFLDVQYEQLVTDTEVQARRLIDYCALEWDEACLNSHNNDRSIKTASVMQVRQPIYQTSIDRWRRYEKHLQPLLVALEDLADSK